MARVRVCVASNLLFLIAKNNRFKQNCTAASPLVEDDVLEENVFPLLALYLFAPVILGARVPDCNVVNIIMLLVDISAVYGNVVCDTGVIVEYGRIRSGLPIDT